MLSSTVLRRPVAGLFALSALAATAAMAEAGDVSITEAKIEAGKLVITGSTTTPNTWVRLDDRDGSDFNVKSGADGTFGFGVVYHPGDCIVELQKLVSPTTLGPATAALVAGCGPVGITPRGAWSKTARYATNDLVTYDGSSWRAKRDNVGRQPGVAADWELFAAKGDSADAEGGESGAAQAGAPARLAPPTGPAGGDLTGTYPNPRIRNLAVNTAKLRNAAVSTAKLVNLAVTAIKLANFAVTTAKIANNAVNSDKILDETITASDLRTDSVAESEIAANAVRESEIATNAVQAAELADNSVDSGAVIDFGLSNQDIGVLFAQVNANGTLAGSSGGVTSTKLGVGTYEVDFGRNVSACAPIMTQGEAGVGGAGGGITGVTDRAGNNEAFFATMRTDANVLVDRAFHLVVVC